MSTTGADNAYEAENDAPPQDLANDTKGDDDYTSRVGQKTAPVPVQSDADPVEDPVDPATADSDAQLEKDDNEAIDKSNIIDERTRGAKPASGQYAEPGDDPIAEQ